MSRLDQYADKYQNVHLERQDGILELRLHSDDGPFVFNDTAHNDFGDLFNNIGRDPDNRVVILTGTGDRFCADFDHGSFRKDLQQDPHRAWRRTRRDGYRMLLELLEIEVPVIAAINGPAYSHSELPLLADIVLASDTTVFRDATHFRDGIPPGDGMHIVWTTLLGLNRGRYFLMTAQTIDANEALRLGIVGEVLPQDQVLGRAWEIARSWAPLTMDALCGTRSVLTLEWKRLFREGLYSGLTHEGLSLLGGRGSIPPPPLMRDLLAED